MDGDAATAHAVAMITKRPAEPMIHALMMIAHRGSDAVIEADAGEAEEQSERLACRHLVAQNRNSRANREHLFEYARDRDGQARRVLHNA